MRDSRSATDDSTLILIESSGLRDRLQDITGYPVFATGGHIWQDIPLGEGPVFNEQGMARHVPRSPAILKALAERLRRSWRTLLVATDPDDEGDVIAADLVALARKVCPRAVLLRVHWQTLEAEAVRRALGRAVEICPATDPPLGAAGLARATIDRLLIEQAGRRPGCGRVAGPLLEALATTSFSVPPKLSFDNPWTLRDILVMGRGKSVEQRYGLAESLYLGGRLSYPRTAAKGYWVETQTILQERAGNELVANLPPPLSQAAPHEALWATGPVFAESALEMLSLPEAVLASVMVAAWISQGLLRPGDLPTPPAIAMDMDARLVDWQARESLGRPSTWAQRATAFCRRQWIGADGVLTPDGRRAHRQVPEHLRDAAFSRAIEAHIAEKAAVGWDAPAIVADAVTRFTLDLAALSLSPRLAERRRGKVGIKGRPAVG